MSPREEILIGNSFEEIVFSYRNKEYGVYDLRKRQKKYLLIAFLITTFMVSSSVIIPLISALYKDNVIADPGSITVQANLENVDQEKFELPKLPEMKMETASLVAPEIKDSVDKNYQFGIVDEYLEIPNATEIPQNITAVPPTDDVIPVEQKPFIKVEVPATFQGGDINTFNNWVLKNINYPQIAVENGITGKVTVQFVVNGKGKVVDVTILRGADPSLDEEAVRVIKSSPDWTAPLQGGVPVKQLFTLPVKFQLQQQ